MLQLAAAFEACITLGLCQGMLQHLGAESLLPAHAKSVRSCLCAAPWHSTCCMSPTQLGLVPHQQRAHDVAAGVHVERQ